MTEERNVASDAPKGNALTAGLSGLGVGAWIAIACVALALGIVVGRFALGGGTSAAGGSASALAGKTTVSESELDSELAAFTYKGTTESITIREVILQNGTLESAIDEAGNYKIPAADYTLAVARNRILEKDAESRGITVSDEELATFTESMLGTADYASIATTYGMDEESVMTLLKNSALMSKLRDEVVDSSTSVEAPAAPDAPATKTEKVVNEETGEEEEQEVEDYDTPTKEYADYIIALAGDEWDSEKGGWVSPDGTYASALAEYEITAEGASYDAANTAYYVAYQLYSEAQSAVSSQWTDYVNGLLSEANLNIHTLVS